MPLEIVSEDVEEEALATLIVNRLRGADKQPRDAATTGKKKKSEVVKLPAGGTAVQPSIGTRSARTTVSLPERGTTVLGGIQIYGGGSVSRGADDDDFSLNPGNQRIDLDANTGFGVSGGAVLPLGPGVAVGGGVKFIRDANDTKRLVNLDGTFVNTTGDADIDSLVAEIMGLFRLPGNITGRVSGYAGRARRKLDLNINGVNALKINDTVRVTGFGVGLAAPASNFLPNMPNNLCFNGGVDFMRYGGAIGLSPTGVPIQLGEIETVTFSFGATMSWGATVHPMDVTDVYQEVPVEDPVFCP